MPIEGTKVIDGDGHVTEPLDLWTSRMDEATWGNWIPHTDLASGRSYLGGEVRSGGADAMRRAAELSGIAFDKITENVRKVGASLARRGGYRPDVRLEDMDRAGIDASVLYPTAAMFFGPSDPIRALQNHEFVRDCQRAYNDWLAEFCSTDPERLFGVGLVPLQDIGMAVAEAARIVDLGLQGVMVRPSPYIDELPLSHSVYDPFWSTCQELGLSVAFHPGVHGDTPGACRKFGLVVDDPDISVVNNTVNTLYGGSGFGRAIGNAADMIVTVGRLIMGGVCERFPSLRFVFLESGGGWMPTILERMDAQVGEFPLDGENLTMAPSDYFRRQCYVSFDADEWSLAASAKWLGADRVLWASNYPHPKYSDGVLAKLMTALGPLEGAEQHQILWANAVEAYGLPIPAAV
ncbi:MAG TPA: amidohydrolase family protein [Acidimicrobiales bacterium]|nr:amidohydrolase family protein [Acidimicrobiales bacterium]